MGIKKDFTKEQKRVSELVDIAREYFLKNENKVLIEIFDDILGDERLNQKDKMIVTFNIGILLTLINSDDQFTEVLKKC